MSNPYTPYQSITFALQIFQSSRDFEDGMKSWHVRPVLDKTWINFKLHFEIELASLRRARGTTMRSIAYHQASLLASRVIEEVKEVKTSVTEALNMLSTSMTNDEIMPPYSDYKANSASQDEVQCEILNFLKKLQDEVGELQKAGRQSKNPTTCNRTNISKYCYSHGACAHDGNDCKPQFRKRGHKVEATFEDKMAGLTACYKNENSD